MKVCRVSRRTYIFNLSVDLIRFFGLFALRGLGLVWRPQTRCQRVSRSASVRIRATGDEECRNNISAAVPSTTTTTASLAADERTQWLSKPSQETKKDREAKQGSQRDVRTASACVSKLSANL